MHLDRPCDTDGQRGLVTGQRAQLAQLFETDMGIVGMDPPAGGAQNGARRDAHRRAVRVVVRQCVGDLAGTIPADPRRRDIAVVRPCAGAHVPVERGVQIASGLDVLADERRLLVERSGVLLFDRGGHPAV